MNNSRSRKNDERLIDEMAVALCGMRSLDDDTACVLALMQQGFRAAEIMSYLDEATILARRVHNEPRR